MLTLFHGDKGGVGKSFCCCTYLDALMTQGRAEHLVVVESDTRNADVWRLFHQHLAVEKLDLKERAGWMRVVDLLDENPEREVVISLPAGIGQQLEKESGYLTFALDNMGHPLSVFWPINRMKDSVILLKAFLATPLAAKASRTTVIMNGFFGELEQFSRWRESKTRTEFLKRPGAREIYLPELHHRVIDTVAAPFSQALKDLPFSARIELERWISQNYQQFFTSQEV